MNRKITLAALISVAIIGSLFTALSSNMFFGDILNFGGNIGIGAIATTMTSGMFTLVFPVLFFFLIRYYQRPKTLKKMSKLYLIMLTCLGGLGLVFALLSGFLQYGTFIGSNPFPGYLIVFMVLNAIVVGLCIYGFLNLKKLPEDEETFKVDVKHVFKTIGWFLFVMLVFNRFGMFMGSPLYIYWRNFYMTFPFYLYLLYPVCLGLLVVLIKLGIFEGKDFLKKILLFVAVGLNVVLFAVCAILGSQFSEFVSAVSPAMPLERLGSMPMEILIHVLSYAAVGVICVVYAFKKPKEAKAE